MKENIHVWPSGSRPPRSYSGYTVCGPRRLHRKRGDRVLNYYWMGFDPRCRQHCSVIDCMEAA